MKKLLCEQDILAIIKNGIKELVVDKDTILTALAIDRLNGAKIKLVRVNKIESGASGIVKSYDKFTKIAVGSDHTGFSAKGILIKLLKDKGYEVIDAGTYTDSSCDYPDFAFSVAAKVLSGEACAGILIDATGIPSAISANKFPGIRAATCYNEFSAKSSREHNNANILAVGAMSLGIETIKSITEVWLNSKFLGDRHQRRLDKISDLEKKLFK